MEGSNVDSHTGQALYQLSGLASPLQGFLLASHAHTMAQSLPSLSPSKSSTSSIISACNPLKDLFSSREAPTGLPSSLLCYSTHTALRGIFPTVSCTVLLPRLLPQLSHTQHCGLTFHFVMAVTHHMCDARLRVACIITIFTPLMSPPVTSLFTHSALPYHILGAHTGPRSSGSRLSSHKLGTTTYYHAVSFPHVYVFDSHDVTPVMYPSLFPESTHKVPTVSHT